MVRSRRKSLLGLDDAGVEGFDEVLQGEHISGTIGPLRHLDRGFRVCVRRITHSWAEFAEEKAKAFAVSIE